MMAEKYLLRLQEMVRKYFSKEETKVCIFGSSVDPERKHFYDVDVGFLGKVEEKKLWELEEELEESTFPFFVDLVNFETASKDFTEFVLQKTNVRWI